ncbi:MFS transporter [Streptomyces sp. S186]|uniref:MFS transporter n=1 Tax=Streptomyces sp. S186 TaxID=3434395 RepID=UPI003F679453
MFFLLFFAFSALAEGAQGVVLLWLTYALTNNAFLIGVMVVLGYLPAALLGLAYQRVADRGRADRLARTTNTVLSTTSFLLAVEQLLAGHRIGLSLVVIGMGQVVLSLVKMVNKAALGRLIRVSFDADGARRFLAMSSSASQIGQVVGAGLAGVVLAQGWVVGGLLGSALTYAASAVCMVLGTRGVARVINTVESAPSSGRAAPNRANPERARSSLRWNPRLVAVLVFSVPSSGGLQFMTTLLVPLAALVAPNQPSYYSLLNVVTVCGGFLAGIALSTNAVSPRRVLGWALPVVSVMALALAALARFDTKYPVALLSFALSLVITCHVVCMQVLTNQVPEEHETGQFAVVRNNAAALAKAAYSFAAGALIGVYGVGVAVRLLAVSMACFSLAWAVLRPAWRPGVAQA